MLHPDKALEIVYQIKSSSETDVIPINSGLGRIMPKPLISPEEYPPFAKSAMDGYAVQKEDIRKKYRILETIAAGETPSQKILPGTCSKIMTGAMIPEGADKVIRVEFTEEKDGFMLLNTEEPYENIIRKGENLKIGDPVLTPRILKPQDIGILAALGIAEIEVSLPPRIGIITTGSELVNPGGKLGPGQIFNSNGYQLMSQVTASACPCKYYGVIEDEPGHLDEIVGKALDECDFLLLSGGVSMGEFDFVPKAVEKNGGEIRFHHLAIKPGKPTLFAQKGNKCIFGMPGNPVSTFIIFEIMVKPALYKWMGLQWKPQKFYGTLEKSFKRRDAARVEFRPVIYNGRTIITLKYHGSAHLNALGDANALIRIEQGIKEIAEGTELDVRLI